MGMADAAGEQAMTPLRLPMVALGLSAPIGFVLVAGQQAPAAVYSAAQAAAGRTVYQASCASCHMPDLAGRNEAPQLAGNNFMNTWRSRSTRDLFEFIQSTMPPTGESLSADQYLAVAAFILQANGAPVGTQAFAPTTAVPIGSIPSGTAAPGAPPGAPSAARPSSPDSGAGAPAGGRGGPGAQRGGAPSGGGLGAQGRGGPPGGILGLTATGTVRNYTPVTDEMLRNQDPGDW